MYSRTSFSCDSLSPLPPQTLLSREEKKTQRFINFVRHDEHCQPGIYIKLVWINRRQSCHVLSTLDDQKFWFCLKLLIASLSSVHYLEDFGYLLLVRKPAIMPVFIERFPGEGPLILQFALMKKPEFNSAEGITQIPTLFSMEGRRKSVEQVFQLCLLVKEISISYPHMQWLNGNTLILKWALECNKR